MHVADPAAPGASDCRRAGRVRRQPALSDATSGVAALAPRTLLGRPQDISGPADRPVPTLQSRPITSTRALADPDARLTIWDNSNIVESYSGVTTPLTFSFAREIYEYVYRQFCRMMGVPEAVIAAQDDTFRNMLGLIRGRLYYNLPTGRGSPCPGYRSIAGSWNR